jgi:hypothetical protein
MLLWRGLGKVKAEPASNSACFVDNENQVRGPMKTLPKNLQSRTLRDRLASRTFLCVSLGKRLQYASFIERPAVTLRWEDTLKDCHILQLMVDLVERQEQRAQDAASLAADPG